MSAINTVKGFRDFLPEDCALRNYIFEIWRHVARRSAFVEYEVPMCESAALYRKKSGDEILSQLFWFKDKKDREIALRPEITPSLARMAAGAQRNYRKPLKWFQIGSCFRYEEPQRGRTREFYQFNVDILGEASAAADAELIALAINVMLEIGCAPGDFVIRLSDRQVWADFAAAKGISDEKLPSFLQAIDKLGRVPAATTETQLAELGVDYNEVTAFIERADGGTALQPLMENLTARGLREFIKIDLSIVRGLAYYTGAVFEVFDLKHGLRAVAGGGRYDNLVKLISDGAVSMPAVGFAMGDVVLGELMKKTAAAQQKYTTWLSQAFAVDIYLLATSEAARAPMLKHLELLRQQGWKVECSLTDQKVNKQFQSAEALQAKIAVIFDESVSSVEIKDLSSRQQSTCQIDSLIAELRTILGEAPRWPLLASQSRDA